MDVTKLRQAHAAFLAVAEADGAGGTSGMISLVRRYGELLCLVAPELTERDLDVSLPVLIVSKDEVMADGPRPLRSLIVGLSETHLPPHAEQLRSLRR